jgi:predicted MFS family arabinose efflux permease
VITESIGWRWVFLGITPFALLGVLLLVPVIRHLPEVDSVELPRSAGPRVGLSPTSSLRRGVSLAAVATAFGISALTWAVQHRSFGTLWLGLAGLAALVPALRALMPRGTFTARPGLPAVVLMRGLLAGAFFGVEAYVPLTLTAVHGFSPAMSGIPLTVGAIGWSSASHWQGRYPDIDRGKLIRLGLLVLGVALAAMALVAADWGLAWLSLPFWTLAGVGMGLAYPSISVLSLDYAAPRDRGFVTSALQVNDMTFSAIMVGLGGVMLATFASATAPSAAIVPLNLLLAGVALVGVLVFRPARQAS